MQVVNCVYQLVWRDVPFGVSPGRLLQSVLEVIRPLRQSTEHHCERNGNREKKQQCATRGGAVVNTIVRSPPRVCEPSPSARRFDAELMPHDTLP